MNFQHFLVTFLTFWYYQPYLLIFRCHFFFRYLKFLIAVVSMWQPYTYLNILPVIYLDDFSLISVHPGLLFISLQYLLVNISHKLLLFVESFLFWYILVLWRKVSGLFYHCYSFSWIASTNFVLPRPLCFELMFFLANIFPSIVWQTCFLVSFLYACLYFFVLPS